VKIAMNSFFMGILGANPKYARFAVANWTIMKTSI
jgi:hypothetical protein